MLTYNPTEIEKITPKSYHYQIFVFRLKWLQSQKEGKVKKKFRIFKFLLYRVFSYFSSINVFRSISIA